MPTAAEVSIWQRWSLDEVRKQCSSAGLGLDLNPWVMRARLHAHFFPNRAVLSEATPMQVAGPACGDEPEAAAAGNVGLQPEMTNATANALQTVGNYGEAHRASESELSGGVVPDTLLNHAQTTAQVSSASSQQVNQHLGGAQPVHAPVPVVMGRWRRAASEIETHPQ